MVFGCPDIQAHKHVICMVFSDCEWKNIWWVNRFKLTGAEGWGYIASVKHSAVEVRQCLTL